MKVSALVVLALLFIWTDSRAQIDEIGFKFGMQSAGMSSSMPIDGRITGFSGFGYMDYWLGNNVVATLNMGLTQRGFARSMNETDPSGMVIQELEAKTRLVYAGLNPTLRLQTSGQNNGLRFFAGAGPRFDWLISRSKGEFDFSMGSVHDETADFFNRFVLGTSFSAGISNIQVHNFRLMFEAVYDLDITDSTSQYPVDYRNNAVMLRLGIGR